MNNVAMFEELSSALKVDEEEHVLPDLEKELILQHLVELESEFIRYFPDIDDDELALVRNPFILPVEKVPDDFQDEFLELKADSCARDLFNEKSITEFWPLMCSSYPKVAKKSYPRYPSICLHIFMRIWVLNSLANEDKTKKQIGCGK